MFKNKLMTWFGILVVALFLLASLAIPALLRWWKADEQPVE
ncbi:hypothetical protein [Larkinella sp. C7]|jgi:maltodextrin utilization protein YvdJ|nr:hypothetical protein [Larkinella sp. C7]